MLRMNLEFVKPASAFVCADHFQEADILVSDDGRELLKDTALPNAYEYNMVTYGIIRCTRMLEPQCFLSTEDQL